MTLGKWWFSWSPDKGIKEQTDDNHEWQEKRIYQERTVNDTYRNQLSRYTETINHQRTMTVRASLFSATPKNFQLRPGKCLVYCIACSDWDQRMPVGQIIMTIGWQSVDEILRTILIIWKRIVWSVWFEIGWTTLNRNLNWIRVGWTWREANATEWAK